MYNVIKRDFPYFTEFYVYSESIKEGDERGGFKNGKYNKKPRCDLPGFIFCDDDPFTNPDYEIPLFEDFEDYRYKNVRRTINKVYDYVRCNQWDLFVTLTFDPQKVDSFSYEAVNTCIQKFLNRIKHRYNYNGIDLKYILVLELHKSGRYHVHALMSGIPETELTFSGKYSYRKNHKQRVYNWDSYDFGFTTAIKVYDSEGAAKYLCKYLTKQLLEAVPPGKKKYWASRNLKLPEDTKYTVDDLNGFMSFLDAQSVYTKRIDFPCVNTKKYIFNIGVGER